MIILYPAASGITILKYKVLSSLEHLKGEEKGFLFLRSDISRNLILSSESFEKTGHTLAWKILWTEEPGRLQSMGSQRVGHDLIKKTSDRETCSNPSPHPSLIPDLDNLIKLFQYY